MDVFASLGTYVNILAKGKIETEIGSGLTKEATISNKINGLKSTYLGGNIGIEAADHITDKIAVSFMPSYNFAVTSSTRDAAVKSYPNTISLATGIRYKL